MSLLSLALLAPASARAVPDPAAAVPAASEEARPSAATGLPTVAHDLPAAGARAVQGEARLDLPGLRRPCLAEQPCGLALAQPASTRGALLAEAERLAALIALALAQREALCIDDPQGRWSYIAGEPLRRCPHRGARHLIQVRLDPAGQGLLASLTFAEASDALGAAGGTGPAPRRAVPPLDGGLAMPAQSPAADRATTGASPAKAPNAPQPLRLRLRTELGEERDVPFAAERLAQALGDALGAEPPSAFDAFLAPPQAPRLHVNVKLGNTLAALDGFDISAFTLRFDIEIDYYIRPYLQAFLEAGLAIGNAQDDRAGDSAEDVGAGEEGADPAAEGEGEVDGQRAGKGSFSLVPVKIGLKYSPLHQYSVRPYIGAGIGLGILSDLVEAESREITLSLSGILGVAWVPLNHLGFNFETSFNFDELRISGGSNVLFGFSVNFGILVLF